MSWILLGAALLLLVLLIGHYGLPEKPIPPPGAPSPSALLEGAAPYRLEGDSGVAFVISHGYSGSAFNTRPLGEFLHSLGHTAIGVLLPGHGTTIEDMNQSRYHHWRDHLERVYLEERGRYRHLFLVGFSMGGTLCLDVAARNADSFRPAGIVTIATPVFFNGFYNGRLVMHSPATMLTGIIKIFRPIVRRADVRAESLDRMNPWVGYRSDLALHALHSFKRAFAQVRAGLERIGAPYCGIMAANDRTVSAQNLGYIYGRVHSHEKRAYTFTMPSDISTMHSLLTHQRSSRRVFQYVETFVRDVQAQIEGARRRDSVDRSLGDRVRSFLGLTRKPQNLADPSA